MDNDCCFDWYPTQNRTTYVEEILKLMDPKIKKTVYATSLNSREDLVQEVKLKIIESIDNVKFEETPGFWEFKQKIGFSD